MVMLRRFISWLKNGEGWFVNIVAFAFCWVMFADFLLGYLQDMRERR